MDPWHRDGSYWSLRCSPGAVASSSTRSTTPERAPHPRLQLRGYDFDGTVVAQRVYDTLAARECVPLLWSDNAVRCSYSQLATVYADAACTQPLGLVPMMADPQPEYLTSYTRDGYATDLWRLGARAPAPTYHRVFAGE